MKKISLQEFCDIYDWYGCVDSNGDIQLTDEKPRAGRNGWEIGDEYNTYRLSGRSSYQAFISIHENCQIEEAHECPNCGAFIDAVDYWEENWKDSLVIPKSRR